MSATNSSSVSEQIWLTAKSRMRAEQRYKQYDLICNGLVWVLSVCVIGVNLIEGHFTSGSLVSNYTIFLAVFILALSIGIYALRFGETAASHRECYLKLQKIRSEISDPDELSKQYYDVLSAYPNHSNHDFESFIVSETFYRKHSLKDSSGNVLKADAAMIAGQIRHALLIWGVPIVLIVGSVAGPFLFALRCD